MNSETSIFDGWTKADLLRAFETLTLATVAILVILLVVRPLVMRALETAKDATQKGTYQPPVVRQIIVDYSKLPLPKLWIRGLQLYGVAAFCFGLGLGIGLNGLALYLLRR